MVVRGRVLVAVAVLSVSVWTPTSASAAAGDLDPSFGNGGKSEITTPPGQNVHDIALQPDGKILLTGSYLGPTNSDIFVARLLNPQGVLDPSYGLGSGWSRLDFGDPDDGGGLVQLPDGRIVVSGSAITSGPGGGRRFVIAQLLNPQGTLDPSYGTGGSGALISRYNALGTTGDADASLAAARQGSNVIIAGYSTYSGKSDYAVARIDASGTQDGSFAGGTGVSYVDFFNGGDAAADVAVQSDGRIVVAGNGSDAELIGVARLLPDGAPDNSFDNDGKTGIVGGYGRAVAIQPDGKIVAAGGSGGDFIVTRLNPNGSLDDSFGDVGRKFVDFGSQNDDVYDVALQPDGKILVTGGGPGFTVARLQPNGALDTTFGNGGKTVIGFGSQQETGWALALQPDGKIIVAGAVIGGLALARLEGDPPGEVKGKCRGKKATIIGTNAKDKLKGTKKKDVISAGDGRDTVKGLKGNDLICGGKGPDKLIGGPGKDTLLGEKGKDKLFGGPQNDKLLGGAAKDTLVGGPDKDKLKGGPGKDAQKQ